MNYVFKGHVYMKVDKYYITVIDSLTLSIDSNEICPMQIALPPMERVKEKEKGEKNIR